MRDKLNLIKTTTRRRIPIVLGIVFFSTLGFYILVDYAFPQFAVGAVVAWGISAIILVMYLDRKRSEILGLENQHREMRSLINLQPLLSDVFLPYSFWAMEPSSMLNVLSVIQYNNYRIIVECGAGVSTLLIGKVLKQMGEGHIYTIEDDKHWFNVMTTAIKQNRLNEYVTIFHAPLGPNTRANELWYDESVVQEVKDSISHIDVLLVDGPKSTSAFSRFPALPMFAPHIDSTSLIILDDTKRYYEKEVIKKWKEHFNLEIEKFDANLRGQTFIRLKD